MGIPPRPELPVCRRAGSILLTLDPRGFVRATSDPLAELTLTDAIASVEVVAELSGVRVPVLVDMTKVKSMSREAREYFGGAEAARSVSAVAIIIDGPVSRMLGTFFLRANVKAMPHRLFSDEKSALEWLLGPME